MTKPTYRKAVATDIEYLMRLRKETMDEHLINSGISLNDEEHLLRINYLFDQTRIIILDNEDIGLLKTNERADNVEIVQIQIDPKYQGNGIGQQVIQSVIQNSLAGGKSISLSVLKENKAKELYLRMGFEVIGEDDTSYFMKFKSNIS